MPCCSPNRAPASGGIQIKADMVARTVFTTAMAGGARWWLGCWRALCPRQRRLWSRVCSGCLPLRSRRRETQVLLQPNPSPSKLGDPDQECAWCLCDTGCRDLPSGRTPCAPPMSSFLSSSLCEDASHCLAFPGQCFSRTERDSIRTRAPHR